jgi:1,3-beta-galactosyl-N-acetylhexosamine phosphorylase
VLAANDAGHVHLAANAFGRGRSVFMAGLPFSLPNCRLLYRALLWAAGKEAYLRHWFCDNLNTECAYFPEAGHTVVVNNTLESQETSLYDGQGNAMRINLGAHQMQWFETDPAS